MFELLKQYKNTILFITKFLVIYAIGSWLYSNYLLAYQTELDPFSDWITKQSGFVLRLFQDDIITRYYEGIPRAYVYCQDQPIYYIIEGCNAMSVMILFLAFLLAFKAKWHQYLWFAPLGLFIIHISNILRIAILGHVAVELPDFSNAFHDYIFPAWIYGTVIILWIAWVKLASK